ncbi:MAG: SufD family Fe-S cluster assembly protein [Solobacterium sp.]|nr:SufD family Fe-S cluster assembly protein [Solobacterium sp.]
MSIRIYADTDILLQEGYSEYEIDTDRDLEVTFRGAGVCDAFIRVVRCGKLRIRTFAEAGAVISYLFWNSTEEVLNVDESHEVLGDAAVTVAYGECNSAPTERKTYVALRQQGASAKVASASLVNAKKTYNIKVANLAPHTYGDMENYAVVLKGGKLMIDAVGKIVNGAYKSESHQTSRALCFDEGQSSQILPELLIDENDVQASHAMSIGRMDEDQLYYMMSRGLNVQQCTSLISTGYLMPITETLQNEDLRSALRNEMERKISELCSM